MFYDYFFFSLILDFEVWFLENSLCVFYFDILVLILEFDYINFDF